MTNREDSSKRMAQRSSLKTIVKILYYLGIWHVENEPRDWLYYWRYLFPRFELFRMCYSLAFQSVNVSLVWGDMGPVLIHLAMCVFYVVVANKLSTLFFQRTRIQAMMEEIEDLHHSECMESEYARDVVNRIDFIIEMFMKFTSVGVGVVATLSVVIGPVHAHIHRAIPFRLWLPYDASYTPVLEVTTFITNILTSLDFAVIVACSASFLAFIIETVGQFRVLRFNLENIHETVMTSVKNEAVNKVPTLESQAVLLGMSVSANHGMHAVDMDELACDQSGRMSASSYDPKGTKLQSSGIGETTRSNDLEYTATSCGLENTASVLGETARSRDLAGETSRSSDRGETARSRDFGETTGLIVLGETARSRDFGETTGLIVLGETARSNDFGETSQSSDLGETARSIGLDERARSCDSFLMTERDDEKVIREMETLLRRYILHHFRILKLVEDTKTVFKSGLDFELLTIMCLSFVGLYITTLAGSLDVKVLIMAYCLLGVAYEFLLFCWFADELTEQSALINDAAYACDWLDASEGFTRSLRIVMIKSQRPLYVRAGGLPLSRITFKRAFKSAYYLHALLNKLYFGEKLFEKMK